MNHLQRRYMQKLICKKCKAAQSPRRTICINTPTRGCGAALRPRRARK